MELIRGYKKYEKVAAEGFEPATKEEQFITNHAAALMAVDYLHHMSFLIPRLL